MPTLTVTAKGQVTLNKQILQHLGVSPGDKIDVDLKPRQEVSITPKKEGRSIESMAGFLYDPNGPKLTLDEIKKAIEDGWAGLR